MSPPAQALPASSGWPRRAVLIAAGAAAAVWPPVLAAVPPERPIRLVVAYPPGGLSDEIARLLATGLAGRSGTPVVVEHRAGAGGLIALEALSRAAPDGRTLCYCATSPLVLPPPDERSPAAPPPARPDVEPLLGVMLTPVLVVGTPAFDGRSFADLLATARARPGALRWATSGLGTLGGMVLRQVARQSGTTITHVPYKGGGPQLNDALGGQFELLSTNVAPLQLRHVAEGRLKPLAVGAPTRLPVLPDVPTLGELGFEDANLASLFGLFTTRGTPAPLLDGLEQALMAARDAPTLQARLAAANNLPIRGGREAFAALMRAQVERWAPIRR